MSAIKRDFEDHIDDYTDEQIIEWGWASNKDDCVFLRECFSETYKRKKKK